MASEKNPNTFNTREIGRITDSAWPLKATLVTLNLCESGTIGARITVGTKDFHFQKDGSGNLQVVTGEKITPCKSMDSALTLLEYWASQD